MHYIYSGCKFTKADSSGNDALTLFGPDDRYELSYCKIDFRALDTDEQDECISLVRGAKVYMHDCTIMGGIKAVLAGNGDHPTEDQHGELTMKRVAIMGCGRRCPEAQDGVTVTMEECWIADWGTPFDVRAFGAWAHQDGTITARRCLFTRSSGSKWVLGFSTTLKDWFAHIGQAVNDYGIGALFRAKTYWRGVTRGLTADTGGKVQAIQCYKYPEWVVVENADEFLSYVEAMEIYKNILRSQERFLPPLVVFP